MRSLAIVGGVLVLVLGVAVWCAFAAETTAPASTTAPSTMTAPAPQPGEGMKEGRGMRGTGGPMTEDTMKKMGMSEGEIMRHQMMSNAQFKNNEPIGLLSLKEQLKLTEEQVKKLEAIDETARKDAKAVLTKEQEAMVDKMTGPETMTEMNKNMMAKHREMRGMEGTPAEEAKETTAKEAKEKAAETTK